MRRDDIFHGVKLPSTFDTIGPNGMMGLYSDHKSQGLESLYTVDNEQQINKCKR